MQLTILGEPVAKGRPKFSNRDGFVKTYTPEKTVNYENLVKSEFMQSGYRMLDGELFVVIKAYFTIPKSTSIKKCIQMREEMIRPTKKPDADNIAKIVCDALNSLAYKDDSQIVSLKVDKYYSDIPRVEISIKGEMI